MNTNTDSRFYSLSRILSKKAKYNIIIGQRSNGKTFACLKHIIENYVKNSSQGAYIRRFKEDYRGKRGETLFDSIVESGAISDVTDGEYDRIKYTAGKWYLAKWDSELQKVVTDQNPFCYAFALTDMEHDKSTSYPRVTTIVYDEFLTRKYYMPNEFVIFCNVLSTIIRQRDDVTIFMLGNTVNKYCPYFKEMGLNHVSEMELGKIDVYTYSDSKLKVAVERCENLDKKVKKSDVYFAFNNPSLQMITGGAWEFMIHPHLEEEDKFKREDIVFSYFIDFDDNLLQADIVSTEDDRNFTYIHRKTTPIKNERKDVIFTSLWTTKDNYYFNIMRPVNELTRRIKYYFVAEKVFYQDNEVGEIVRNYIVHCKKSISE